MCRYVVQGRLQIYVWMCLKKEMGKGMSEQDASMAAQISWENKIGRGFNCWQPWGGTLQLYTP